MFVKGHKSRGQKPKHGNFKQPSSRLNVDDPCFKLSQTGLEKLEITGMYEMGG
jgi:hypothetical protein